MSILETTAESNVHVAFTSSPATEYLLTGDVQSAIDLIKDVHEILQQRINEEGFESQEVCLVVNGWLTFYRELEQCEECLYNSVMLMLAEITLKGKEVKILLILGSQSNCITDTGLLTQVGSAPASIFTPRGILKESIIRVIKMSILETIATSNVHVLVVSKTGDGTTTTLLGLIDQINKTHGKQCQFFIISPRSQAWMGLNDFTNEYEIDGVITSSPAVVYPFSVDLQSAVDQIKAVYQILQQRRECELSQNDFQPFISLIIDEWQALYRAFKHCEEQLYNSVMSMLVDITLTGREYNIRLILGSRSRNVADVGLLIQFRHYFITLIQEKITKDCPCKVIPKALNDPWFVDLADLPALNKALDEIHRNATDKPQFVGLSDCSKPILDVLPDLSDLHNTVLFGQ